MEIMQVLPTNKPSFLLKHTEDFNQTTNVAPYELITFSYNLSFSFNSLNSVQLRELKGSWSHHGDFDMVFNTT